MLVSVLAFLFLIAGSLAVFSFFVSSLPEAENKLLPFAVLPVSDCSPSVKAFLEFYASQIAWMDSEILYTVLLVYPDDDSGIQKLCEEISRQYDFFTPVSLSEAKQILDSRVKISEIL